ncbi:butyrate kinase [Aquibacillus sediminis]|uniref:butyrate kinase n=1 Tax=Aquibacillus sediminis TaxID=2574734 RepID=UPI001109C5A6|nr:butyrate kinase [Aquibacillus sediminis]
MKRIVYVGDNGGLTLHSKHRIIVINPSAYATRVAVFEEEICMFEKSIRHPSEKISSFHGYSDQADYRKQLILQEVESQGINLSKCDAVCGRGGLLRPIAGGTYIVNQPMLQDLHNGYHGQHASNLGGILAYEIASGLNVPAYIVDPVVVDEMSEVARITGVPEISRVSIFHALNQKSVARQVASELGKPYQEANFIICHMGGGITIGAHKNGQVIDVNNGLHGDGPLSVERAGTVPAGDLIDMCYSGDYSYQEMMDKIVGNGGLMAFLRTDEIDRIETMIHEGDHQAELLYQAMTYQVAKELGAMATVLEGEVEAIILTGKLASHTKLVSTISNKVDWIADIFVYPGENELLALAQGTLRVLRGQEQVKEYIVH